MMKNRTEDNRALRSFNTAYRDFQNAEQTVKFPVDRFYSIGGRTIRLRFAGSALVPRITPALEHLTTQPDASPALTVCLWDGESTQSLKSPAPRSLKDDTGRGEVRHFYGDRILTAYNNGSGAVSMMERSKNLALWWIRDAADVPFYESGSPLLTLFHWWMNGRGLQVVHAGAVGTRKAGVLLAGRSGSGKSTTALACLDSELLYAGDDHCLLGMNPIPYVFSLYSSAKLEADQMQRFPHLLNAMSHLDRPDTEKMTLLLGQHYPDKMTNGFPVRAIFVPRVAHRPDTTLSPISAGMALRALAPTTLLQLPYAKQSALADMARFVKKVPCFELELGTELHQIPEVIMNFLSQR